MLDSATGGRRRWKLILPQTISLRKKKRYSSKEKRYPWFQYLPICQTRKCCVRRILSCLQMLNIQIEESLFHHRISCMEKFFVPSVPWTPAVLLRFHQNRPAIRAAWWLFISVVWIKFSCNVYKFESSISSEPSSAGTVLQHCQRLGRISTRVRN